VLVLALIAGVLISMAAGLALNEGDDDPIEIEGAGGVQKLFGGIPQEGARLGSDSAEVTIEVLNDMHCERCAEFQLDVVEPLVERHVRDGGVKLDYLHNSLSDRSTGLGFFGAVAAGEQGRQWQFIHLFFINQEEAAERGVTDDFLERLAAAVLELDQEVWRDDFDSPEVEEIVERDAERTALRRFPAEPAVVVDGPRGTRELPESPSLDQIEQAIRAVD